MGKYVLYITIALIIAFFANFFGFVEIPWLDPPIPTEKSHYTKGSDRMKDAAEDVLKDQQ